MQCQTCKLQSMSKQCHRTKDTAMPCELETLIADGDKLDNDIVNYEKRWKSKQTISLSDLTEVSDLLDNLKKKQTESNTRNKGLFNWIRMGEDKSAK